MIGKLCIALVVVAVVGAQASIYDYIERNVPGNEGFQQACFLKAILEDASKHYRGEVIEHEIRDLMNSKDMESELYKDDDLCSFGCRSVGRSISRREITWRTYDNSQCRRWSKFKRLCEMITARQSPERSILAVEGWVCEVMRDNEKGMIQVYQEPNRCVEYPLQEEGRKEASKEFHKVILYTEEELKQARDALDKEVAAERRLRAEHDAKTTEEARRLIKERFEKHLAEYKICSVNEFRELKEKRQRAIETVHQKLKQVEAEEEAARQRTEAEEEPEKKRRRFRW